MNSLEIAILIIVGVITLFLALINRNPPKF